MARKTSDSRSRHKTKKETSSSSSSSAAVAHPRNSAAGRGKRTIQAKETEPRHGEDAVLPASNHDPKAASAHPPNCECLRLRPGLFLPPPPREIYEIEGEDNEEGNDKS